MGGFRLQGSIDPILEHCHGSSTIHAAGPQEQCHFDRSRTNGQPLGEWKWRLHGQDLEIRTHSLGGVGSDFRYGENFVGGYWEKKESIERAGWIKVGD